MKEKEYLEKIKKEYTEKENTKLDELKRLNKKAMLPAHIFAYSFGIFGSLILGFGMCIAMEVILPDMMWVGILIGCVGILMVSVNYLIYKKLLNHGKSKYKDQILALSEDLLN